MGSLFGGASKGPPAPPPEVEPQRTEVDPDRDQQLARAAKKRREALARRGRSSLKTGDSQPGQTRGGVSVNE